MWRSALARLGSPDSFVSRISADANGEALAAALVANGVDLGFVARDVKPTTLAFVMRGTAKTGSRYSFYLDATAFDGPWPFPAEWPKGARHLHVGSIAAVDARHGRAVVAALNGARAAATVSFDPNIRPLVTPDRDAGVALVERQVALAHLVKASEEDLVWLYPDRPIEETLAAWAESGPRFCVATLGERGALAFLGDERLELPPRQVEVVDTVGAGDSFMSALLSAMDRDRRAGRRRAGAELAANSRHGSLSRRPPRRSPAPARAPIRRRAPKSRLRSTKAKIAIERWAKTPNVAGAGEQSKTLAEHQLGHH